MYARVLLNAPRSAYYATCVVLLSVNFLVQFEKDLNVRQRWTFHSSGASPNSFVWPGSDGAIRTRFSF